MLAVGIPRKGTMYITNGILSVESTSKFMQVVAMKFNEKEQTKPISNTIFIVQDGAVSGVIQPKISMDENDSEKPSKNVFWEKIFGKS